MLTSYLVGALGTVGLLLLWIAVQGAWRRSFPDAFSDPDVLAGRPGCDGCSHEPACEHRTSRPTQEETP